MGTMNEDSNLKGYVVAFDDITNLVSAQRSAVGVMLQEESLTKLKIHLLRYNCLLRELEENIVLAEK